MRNIKNDSSWVAQLRSVKIRHKTKNQNLIFTSNFTLLLYRNNYEKEHLPARVSDNYPFMSEIQVEDKYNG